MRKATATSSSALAMVTERTGRTSGSVASGSPRWQPASAAQPANTTPSQDPRTLDNAVICVPTPNACRRMPFPPAAA